MSTFLNLACFQGTWLAVVHGAAAGLFWPGALALGASCVVQASPHSPVRLPPPGFVAAAVAAGFTADLLLVRLDLLGFPAGQPTGLPVPAWMSLLWANFATTLDESLAWGGDRTVLAAAGGAVGGLAAYEYGASAGALQMRSPLGSRLAVAGLWMIAFPLLAVIAKTLRDRRQGEGARR